MSSPPPTNPPPMVWPAPPSGNVVPFPLPWGQTGCCPSGGMSALWQCYNDIQQAQAFICATMLTCIQNDPALTAAIIAAIEASSSSLPLTGVTNGSDAQPGQVGEWVLMEQTVAFTAAPQVQTVTMGILQPGDWDVWIYANSPSQLLGLNIDMTPFPVGLEGLPQGFFISDIAGGVSQVVVLGPQCRMLISVPTLIPVTLYTNQSGAGPGPGSLTQFFSARRRR